MDKKPKTYTMLKSSKGVREGEIHPVEFHKGETYEIDEALAEQFYHQGVIGEAAGKNAKVNPAEARETKVTSPAEAKDGEAGVATGTQHIEELNSVARDHYGLDTDTTMKRAELKRAVDEAGEGKDPELPESESEPLTSKGASKKAKK